MIRGISRSLSLSNIANHASSLTIFNICFKRFYITADFFICIDDKTEILIGLHSYKHKHGDKEQ